MDGKKPALHLTLHVNAYSGNNVNYTQVCILDQSIPFCSSVKRFIFVELCLLMLLL